MSDAPAIRRTPNDMFRRFRRTYLCLIGLAFPLLFLAIGGSASKLFPGAVTTALLAAGLLLFIGAMLVMAATRCPVCGTSLMRYKASFGMGGISLGVKQRCPGCGLDLEAPWPPDASTVPAVKPLGPEGAS